MDDGASSPNMFESFSGNNLDYELMDELFDDGYWLETTKESKFSLLEPNIYDFNPNLYQQNYGQGVERSDFDETHLLDNPLMVDFGKKQTTNREVILANSYSDHSEKFLIESSEPNKRLWIAPLANPAPFVSVKNRLMCAIEYLGKLTKDSDVLIQIWVPIKREGKQFLTTDDQPFTCNDKSTSLANFRDVSKKYNFPAEEDSKDFIGLPGRVFLKKKLEWTPDVRFFKIEEYPRVNYAQQCNVSGSLALPVFERESGNCLGVVEIVRTTRMINHRLELENICKALEAVDLRSSEISSPLSVKGCDDSYEAVLSEIRQVLQYVCDAHNLPLAQTWALCAQEGKSECCLDSNKTPSLCISIIESACYVRDEKVRPYHEACSQHCLNIGEGIVGEAFVSNQPCFATDIAAFSKTDYPLSHYTKMFDLHGSVAIRLRSMYTGSADFVLEFFLPSDCTDVDEQWRMLGLLSSGIQRVCRSLRVLTDDEAERENIVLLSEKSVERENIITDAQGKGKGLDIASEYKESEFEVFEEKPQFENENIYQDLGSKGGGESGGEFFRSVGKKSGEKRRTKSEKNISLQVLRQYFAGSLKDAAKSIGVCPTTLKRICRQHGITRWPSRKIKKVGHSLRKLQLVIDSVQGVEGPIQLNSFYSNFPELSSTNIMNKCSAPQLEDHLKPFSTQLEASVSSPATTTSKSSCSQSSGSSFSTEEKPPLVTTSLAEQPPLRALSETELHELGREGKKHLAKSQSDENLRMENRNSKDGSGFHVKATFGEEKIRFSLQQNWVFGDVKKEILRRFHIDENGKIDLKYLDDDSEWVLLTCDADLEECIDIHRSTKSRTIKITVHHGFNSNIVGSFGSSVLS